MGTHATKTAELLAWEGLKCLVFSPARGLWGPPGARVSKTCSGLTKSTGRPCSALVWLKFALFWIRALLSISNRNLLSFRLKRGVNYEDTGSAAEQCKELLGNSKFLRSNQLVYGPVPWCKRDCRQTKSLRSPAQESIDLGWNPDSTT